MKKAYLLFAIPLLMAACKQPAAKTDAPAAAATPNYPYKIAHPDYWTMDTSHVNTMTALTTLKAFETMDTVTLKKGFADSLEFNYDGGKFKGPIAEFIKMTAGMSTTMKGLKIDMKDWESVVSSDKKEEWVTLWYIQKWTDDKGKADSVSLINDMQFKGGKIVKLNEYDMHFKPVGK
ncbi:MAG: hypothetical protein V4592_27110 [Bacteroidota bacterium]